MPHGTLDVVLVSAKGLEDTDFLSKFSLITALNLLFSEILRTHFSFEGIFARV